MSGYQTYLPPAGSTGTDQIAAGAVTTPKLADGAVTEAKIDPVYRSMIDPLSTFPSYGTTYGLFEGPGCTDFLTTSSGVAPYNIVASGTGATQVESAGSAARPGILEMQTGTDATGRSAVRSATNAVLFGGGTWRCRSDVNIPTASDGTNTFISYAGFIDALAAEPTDGVYFRYQHTENSGNWTCVCRSNGVETTANSGIAAVHATAYRSLGIQVNAAGNEATFYVDGVLVATIATNIPVGAGRETGVGINIRKTLGGTSRSMLADLLGSRFAATAAR